MNKICRMGENYAFIKPNGDVERCCKDHSISLGNIIKKTFRLLEEPVECNIEDCYCWRRMLFGEEKKWTKYWNGTWDQFYALQIEEILRLVENKQLSYDDGVIKVNDLTLKIKNLNSYIQRIKQVKHDIICACLLDGYKYINDNNIEFAKKFINGLLEKYSKDMLNDTFLHCYVYMARIYMISSDFEKAKKYVQVAMKYNSAYPSLYKLFAMINYELKDFIGSKKMFMKAVLFAKRQKNNKELSEIYYEMAVCIEKYYKLNVDCTNKEHCLNLLIKLLNKSKKYDNLNFSCIEKLKIYDFDNNKC